MELGSDIQDGFGLDRILVAYDPGKSVPGNHYATHPYSVLYIENGNYWTGLYGPMAYQPESNAVHESECHESNFHKAYHQWIMNCR